MFSQELINEDNPYGLLPKTDSDSGQLPPSERPKEDPYYPDPYA